MTAASLSDGILNEPTCQALFKHINERPYCQQCQADRIRFAQRDKKHNDSYSDLLPGFSSEFVRIPTDVLIVAEAHGGGRKGVFTPEDAFVASINMCTHMTFLAVCERARLNLVRYECEAKGEAESEMGNIYHFSRVTLYPKIVVIGSTLETVHRLLGIAKRNCMVSNSVKCPVDILPEIRLEQEDLSGADSIQASDGKTL